MLGDKFINLTFIDHQNYSQSDRRADVHVRGTLNLQTLWLYLLCETL